MSRVDWMHPSYRDLIIDELIGNREFRIQFLKAANIQDLSFALSTSGGADGTKQMPLIVDEESKQIVADRFLEISKKSTDYEIWRLLEILDYAIKKGNSQKEWLIQVLKNILLMLHKRWAGISVFNSALEAYCRATLYFHPLIPLPDFEPSLKAKIRLIENELAEDNYLEGWLINNFVELIKLIQKNEPRLFLQIELPKTDRDFVLRIVDNLENDINSHILAPSQKEIGNEIDRISDLRNSLINLIEVIPEWDQFFLQIICNFEKKRDELAERIHEEPEQDYEDFEDSTVNNPIFDIDKLFEDL